MYKGIMKSLALIVVVFFLASCTMKTYVQDRDRVDQKMLGNAGCLQGDCPDVDRSDIKKTRRTFVLEIQTKPKDVVNDFEVMEETRYEANLPPYEKPLDKISVPKESFQPVELTPAKTIPVTYIEYTIQEGDTLQKISKKFYDTYQRWVEIYEINKDVIPNPDKIKPGKVIQIPQS
jgi:LysM repeat protein